MTRRLSIIAIGLVLTAAVGCGDFSNSNDTNEAADRAAAFDQQIDTAKQRAQANPTDPEAWLGLTQANLSLAQSDAGIDPKSGAMTDRGKQAGAEGVDAWERYLKLTKQPDASTAERVAAVNGSMEDPAAALDAQRIVAEQRPDQTYTWAKVALFAYASGNDSLGDRAQAKAIDLTDKDKRESTRTQLQQEEKRAKDFYENSGKTKTKTETTP
jgi:hypothetical protein